MNADWVLKLNRPNLKTGRGRHWNSASYERRQCYGCRAYEGLQMGCSLGYEIAHTPNPEPLEKCPKPRTRKHFLLCFGTKKVT